MSLNRRDALNVRIFAAGIDYFSIANDVVDDDRHVGTRRFERPLEVAWNVVLVGIDEDEVKGPEPIGSEFRQRIERLRQPEFDHVSKPGQFKILEEPLPRASDPPPR